METAQLRDCLLNDRHFFEDMVAPRPKKRKVAPLLLTLLAFTSPLAAGTYTVTDLSDNPQALNGGTGTLRNAILLANSDPNPSVIILPPQANITLQGNLPIITSSQLTLMGMGSTPVHLDGQGQFRGLLTNGTQQIGLENISFSNFAKVGYAGGSGTYGGGGGGAAALGGVSYLAPGTVMTVTSSAQTNNSVTGGSGGTNYAGTSGYGIGGAGGGGGGGAGPGGKGGSSGTGTGGSGCGGGGGGGGTPTTGPFNGGDSTTSGILGAGGGASWVASGEAPASTGEGGSSGGDGGSNPGSGGIASGETNLVGGKSGLTGADGPGGGGGAFLPVTTTPPPPYDAYQGGGGNSQASGGGGGATLNPLVLTDYTTRTGNTSAPSGGPCSPAVISDYFWGGGGGGGGGGAYDASASSAYGVAGSGGSGGIYAGGGGGGSLGDLYVDNPGKGGAGGFGGGGGGGGSSQISGVYPSGGAAGYGGGAGGTITDYTQTAGGGGGGGGGFGGVYYLDSGFGKTTPTNQLTTLTLNDVSFSTNSASGGAGGSSSGVTGAGADGKGFGSDIFMTSGSTLNVNFVNNTAATIHLDGDNTLRSGGMASSTLGGLTVNGLGILTLSNESAYYTGTITINGASTISVGSDGGLGVSTNPVVLNGSYALGGASLIVTSSSSGTRDFTTNITGGPSIPLNAISASGSGVTYDISGSVTGNGGLILTGGGQINLKNTGNSYQGFTNIDVDTTVGVTGIGSLPPATAIGTASIFLNGTLKLIENDVSYNNTFFLGTAATINTSSASGTFSGPLEIGGGTLTLEGSNTITIESPAAFNNSYSGVTDCTVATLQSSGDSPFGTSTLNINSGTTNWNLIDTNNISSPININTDISLVVESLGNSFTGSLGGSGTVSYSGLGSLTLNPATNSSDFTGTFINNGLDLYIGGTNALGGASAIYILTGSDPQTRLNVNGTYANKIEIDTDAAPEFDLSAGVTATFSGVISDRTAGQSTGTVLFGGDGLTSIIGLSGANTFTVGYNSLGNQNSVIIAEITAQLSGTSPLGNPANNVELNGGALEFIANTALQNSITFGGTTTNYLIADTGTASILIGDLTDINGSGYSVGLTTGTENGTILLAGTSDDMSITLNQGTLQTFAQTNLGTGPITFGTPSGTLEVLTSGNSFSNGLTITSPGTLSLAVAGATTWTGTLSGGSTLSVSGPSTGTGTLNLSGGHNGSFNGTLTLNPSVVLDVTVANDLGTSTIDLNGGSLDLLGSATFPNDFAINSPDSTLILTGTTNTYIGTLSGADPLVLSGTNTLILSGGHNGAFTSGLTINAANVQATVQNDLGTGTVSINGGSLKLLGAATFTNPISLGTTGATIAGGNSGTTNTLSGAISDSGISGALTISGPGTIALSGNNTNFGGGILLKNSANLNISSSQDVGSGSITFDDNTSSTISLSGSNSYSTPIVFTNSGTISTASNTINTLSGALTGSGTFTYAGTALSSDLILSNSAAAGFTGPFTIKGGTITISGANALGSGTITLDGSTGTGGVIDFGAASSLSNAIQLTSHPANTSVFQMANNGVTATITGQISGSDPLIFSGPGTLFLDPSTSNTFSGGTTFNGGILEGSGTNPFGTGTLTYANGAGGITLTGTGSYANPFTFNVAPTITLSSSASSFTSSAILSGSVPVTLTGTGYLNLAGANPSLTGGWTLDTGTTLGLGVANSAGTGTIGFNGGTLYLNGITGIANPLSVSATGGTITLASGTTNSFVAPSAITGSGLLTIDMGTEAWAMNGSTILNISGQNNSGFTGSFDVENGVILEVTNANNLNARPLTLNGGQLTFLSSDTFASPTTLNAGGGTFAGTGTNTLSGDLTGAGPLTFNGSGTLIVSGTPNTYSGGTTLAGGTLQTAGTNPLGTGTLTFNRGNLTLSGPTSLSTPITFTQSAVITVDSTATFSGGPITGSQGFVLTGGGTLAITSANNTNFSGPVMLTSGTLQTSGTGSLGTGSLVLTSGGLLELTNTTTLPNNILLMSTGTIQTDTSTTTLNGTISDFISSSSLTKTGMGTLVINGVGSYAGSTTAKAGTLVVNGSLESPTTINAGATLSGSGVINAPLNVFGTVIPGNGTAPFLVGTLTAGSTTFNPDSTFQVLLNGSQSSALVSTGNVTLSSSAHIVPNFNPVFNQQYVVIQSAGIITGQFAPYSFVADRFSARVLYFPHEVVVDVGFTPFSVLLPKGNLQNIGACIDSASPNTPGLTSVISTLNTLTTAQTVTAFNQLDPSFYNVLAFAQESVSERVRNTYTQHIFERNYDPEFLNDVYVAYFAEKVHQDSFGDVPSRSGYDDLFSGFVLGIDRYLNRDLIASTGFSYARSRVDWSHVNAKTTLDSYTGYVAAAWLTPRWILDAYGSYTRHQAEGSRGILIEPNPATFFPNPPFGGVTFSGPVTHVKPRFRGNSESYTTHLGAISKQQINDSAFYLLAYLEVDYLWVKQQAFTEQNGGALALTLHSKRSDLLQPESGIGFGGSGIVLNGQNLFFEVDVAYLGMFRFQGQQTKANFVNNDCVFLVSGLKPNHNLIRPSLSFGISSSIGFDVAFNYSGAFGNRYSENEGKIELTYLF